MDIEKRIRKVLAEYGAQPNIIEMYLDEAFAYDDISAYKDMSDDDITDDFDAWLEE